MIVPESYAEVRRLIEAGTPLVFVSGNAGTGKTTLIRHLREALSHRSVVLAPTGVAALNAGGVTVHSFFQFPPRIQDPGEVRVPADRKLYQKLDLLIIDEISMLRADLLDGIDAFLRKSRGLEQPFGGVQLLLLGDMFQLPPVVPRHEWEVLDARGYVSPYFFSAFSLRDMPLAHVELNEVFRQTDADFVSLLNRVRIAEERDAVVDELNRQCGQESADHEITLTCTNKAADAINAAAMDSLDSEEFLFPGESKGKFGLDGDRLPSPIDLRLKVGAHIMFTKNDEAKRWVNGSLGTVRRLGAGSVAVANMDGKVYEVERATWQTFKYALDENGEHIVATEAGSYTQFPLMLAWAVTIHKSQGKTLGKVLVDFGSGTFASGQTYVALSRCRSVEDIRLARPLRASDIRCDPRIQRFYQALSMLQSDSAGHRPA